MGAKVITPASPAMMKVIKAEAALKAAKAKRKLTAAAAKAVVTVKKVETPTRPVGEGLSRAARKAANRASRRSVAPAPPTPAGKKTLRKRAKKLASVK